MTNSVVLATRSTFLSALPLKVAGSPATFLSIKHHSFISEEPVIVKVIHIKHIMKKVA
jgi:hypothetical protein